MALFSELANAALAKGLPMLEGWLRERLGDGANIGELRVVGSRVELERARLPITPRMVLSLDRAAVAVVTRALASPRPYVAEAQGELTVEGGGRRLTARVELVGRDGGEAWLAGKVRVIGCRIGSEPELSGELDVELTATGWQLRGTLAGAGVSFQLEADGRLGSARGRRLRALRVELARGSAGMLAEQLACWVDVAVDRAWQAPWGAEGKGTIRWTEDLLELKTSWSAVPRLPSPLALDARVRFAPRSAEGEARLASAHSACKVTRLVYRDGRFDGTRCELDVALAEAREALPGPIAPTARGAIQGELTLSGGAADWQLAGPVTAPVLELETAARRGVPALAVTELSARVELSRERLSLSQLGFEGYGGRFSGAATVPLRDVASAPLLSLRIDGADARLVDALAALAERPPVTLAQEGARPPGARWLPRELDISGELALEPTRALRATLALEAPGEPGSELLVELCLSPDRRLDGSSFRGRAAVRDLLLLGLLDGPIAPRPVGAWQLEGRLEGPVDAPALTLDVATPTLALVLWGKLELPLEDVRARALLDKESLVWNELEARLFGGRVTGEGVVGFTRAFAGLDCDLRCEEVQMGRLELGGQPLSRLLEGRLGACLHLRRAAGALRGEAEIALSEPSYHLVANARRQLNDVGLPPPPVRGVGPLSCRVELDDAAARIVDLTASLEGLDVRADGRIAHAGDIDASARVILAASYLRKSPLLVVPATLAGGLTLPVRVSGTVAAPIFHARLAEALARKLKTREISSAVSGAVGELRGLAQGLLASFKGREKSAASPADLEAIVARCLEDNPDDDTLIDRLIDAGVTADDIVAILDKRRK